MYQEEAFFAGLSECDFVRFCFQALLERARYLPFILNDENSHSTYSLYRILPVPNAT